MHNKKGFGSVAIILIIAIVLVAGVVVWYYNMHDDTQSSQSSVPSSSLVSPIFISSLTDLKNQGVDFPILLPSKLPQDLSGLSLYAHVAPNAILDTTSTVDTYDISIEADPKCNGANACFIGEIFAKKNDQLSNPANVSLIDNIKGSYREGMCGASCSPNTLEWIDGGILYSLQFKESEANLISLANDMIQGGAR